MTTTRKWKKAPALRAEAWRGVPADGGTGKRVDFEDTYDGLGDQLDDADDALNDATFGADETGPATQASVGKDYDFFGQTAKVSDAITEEQLRFNRHAPSAQVATASSLNTAKAAAKPVRTGYEKYRDPGSIPDLQVNASLWGVAPKKAGGDAARPSEERRSTDTTVVPPGRKVMSLEEVEAALLSQKKKQPPPQAHAVQAQPPVQRDQSPMEHVERNVQPEFRQPPPQGPRNLPMASSRAPPAEGQPQPASLQRPELGQFHTSDQAAPAQPRQILQNPNRHPVQMNPAQGQGVGQRPVSMPQTSVAAGGFMPPMPMFTHPHQLVHLSEEARLAYLREEARRAKRNHKIHLLSKDNGLMTPQDKNFITRVQLQQLVTATGNPNERGTDAVLVEDFYYQVHCQIRGPRQNPQQPLTHFAQTYLFQTGARQGGAAGRRLLRGGDSHVHRMEQQVQRAVEAAKLKPKNKQLVIEGSLGKISFSNAKTPKPLLNIKRSDSSQDANRPQLGGRVMSDRKAPASSTSMSDRKTVLRQIEQVYMALMEMEDHERHKPAQPASASDASALQQHMEWTRGMQELNQKLWTELRVMEPIIPK